MCIATLVACLDIVNFRIYSENRFLLLFFSTRIGYVKKISVKQKCVLADGNMLLIWKKTSLQRRNNYKLTTHSATDSDLLFIYFNVTLIFCTRSIHCCNYHHYSVSLFLQEIGQWLVWNSPSSAILKSSWFRRTSHAYSLWYSHGCRSFSTVKPPQLELP